jgi:hypothetical protein
MRGEMPTPSLPAPGDIVVRAVHSDSGPRHALTRRIDSDVMWEYVAFIGSEQIALRFACNAARGHGVFHYPTAGSDESRCTSAGARTNDKNGFDLDVVRHRTNKGHGRAADVGLPVSVTGGQGRDPDDEAP